MLGIRGEPRTPSDPAQGLVWSSIISLIDRPGAENEFVSVSDTERRTLECHPWSLSGGSAPEILKAIENAGIEKLNSIATEIGFGAILGEDAAFILGKTNADSRRDAGIPIRPLVLGDDVRDWTHHDTTEVIFPYDKGINLLGESVIESGFWPLRSYLWARNVFGGQTFRQAGRGFWEYHQMPVERSRIPLSITFAEVATHNHFVLDRGGKVFKQTAPVIKLPAGTNEDTHLGLLGLLNSSTACFWLQQVCHNKGGPGGGSSKDEKWHDFYQVSGTRLMEFPLPKGRPISLAQL